MINRRHQIKSALAERKMFANGGMVSPNMPQGGMMPPSGRVPAGILASSQPMVNAATPMGMQNAPAPLPTPQGMPNVPAGILALSPDTIDAATQDFLSAAGLPAGNPGPMPMAQGGLVESENMMAHGYADGGVTVSLLSPIEEQPLSSRSTLWPRAPGGFTPGTYTEISLKNPTVPDQRKYTSALGKASALRRKALKASLPPSLFERGYNYLSDELGKGGLEAERAREERANDPAERARAIEYERLQMLPVDYWLEQVGADNQTRAYLSRVVPSRGTLGGLSRAPMDRYRFEDRQAEAEEMALGAAALRNTGFSSLDEFFEARDKEDAAAQAAATAGAPPRTREALLERQDRAAAAQEAEAIAEQAAEREDIDYPGGEGPEPVSTRTPPDGAPPDGAPPRIPLKDDDPEDWRGYEFADGTAADGTPPAKDLLSIFNQRPNITKADSEDLMAKYIAQFKENMPEYEGLSEEEKGWLGVEAGLRIMAGQSPNAITNIANGLKGLGTALAKDAKEKRAWTRQVGLSAAKYALESVAKDRVQEIALAAEGRKRPYELVALKAFDFEGRPIKEGQAFPGTEQQLREGLLEKYPLTYAKTYVANARAVAALAKKALGGRVNPESFTKVQAKYLDDLANFKSGVRMKAVLRESARLATSGGVLGGTALLKDYANKAMNALNIQMKDRSKFLQKYSSTKREEYSAKQKRLGTLMATQLLRESSKTLSDYDRKRVEELIGALTGTGDSLWASENVLKDRLISLEMSIDDGIRGSSNSMLSAEETWRKEITKGGTSLGNILLRARQRGLGETTQLGGSPTARSYLLSDIYDRETKKFKKGFRPGVNK